MYCPPPVVPSLTLDICAPPTNFPASGGVVTVNQLAPYYSEIVDINLEEALSMMMPTLPAVNVSKPANGQKPCPGYNRLYEGGKWRYYYTSCEPTESHFLTAHYLQQVFA